MEYCIFVDILFYFYSRYKDVEKSFIFMDMDMNK